jgi:hypothetical protein
MAVHHMREHYLKRSALIALVVVFLLALTVLFSRSRTDHSPAGGAVHPAGAELQPTSSQAQSRIPQVPEQDSRKQVVETAASSAPENGVQYEVTITNDRYQPLAGAELRIDAGDSLLGVWKADEQGKISVSLSERPTMLWSASASGHAHQVLVLDAPQPREVTIALQAGITISGWVRKPGGVRVDAGTLVVAYPSTWRQTPSEWIRRWQQGEAAPWTTRTRDDGSYQLDGVGTGMSCTLIAYEEGQCGLVVVEPLHADARKDIVLESLVMTCIQLVDAASGEVLRPRSNLLDGYGMRVSFPPNTVQPLSLSLSMLHALMPTLFGREADEGLILNFYLGVPGSRVSMSWEFPGYQAADERIAVQAYSASLAPIQIRLAPDGLQRGTILVRSSRQAPAAPPRLDQWPATITVYPEQGEPMQFVWKPRADGLMELGGVPQGTNRLVFGSRTGAYMVPPPGGAEWRVVVRESPITVDLPEIPTAGLLLRPQHPDGVAYNGPLQVSVIHNTATAAPAGIQGFGPVIRGPGGQLAFAGPPYRVDWLQPGEYSVILGYPGQRNQPLTVRAEAGEHTPIVIPLR